MHEELSQPQGIAKHTLATHNDETMFIPLHAIHGTTIFRGQNARHTPCAPNIWRNTKHTHLMEALDIKRQAKLVLLHAKSLWFYRDIEFHPAIKWARNKKIYVDKASLAQHYELFTDYIDFSHNFAVAAFFATNRKNGANWEPAKKGTGVIYILQLKELPEGMMLEGVKPVTLQTFPRPDEQSGWVVEVPLGYDLESLPGVYYAEFEQSEEVSNYFLEMFNRGDKLFPEDEVATIAEKIKNWNGSIEEAFVDRIIEHWSSVEWGIKQPADVKKHIASSLSLGAIPNFMLDEDLSKIEHIWEEKQSKYNQLLEIVTVHGVAGPYRC